MQSSSASEIYFLSISFGKFSIFLLKSNVELYYYSSVQYKVIQPETCYCIVFCFIIYSAGVRIPCNNMHACGKLSANPQPLFGAPEVVDCY